MLKSYRAVLVSLSLLLVLSGCSNAVPIDAHSTGIWDHYFVYPISFMIQFVAHHIPGASFGIAIIIMTLVIRSAMIPLAVSQYRSQAKMKKMQPELQKLKKKYGDVGKDLEKQKQYQKEMSELMKSGGWNPLAGCWPILYKCRFSLLCIMRLAERKRFAHLLFMGELRTCRSISYITDYCSVNDIYSDESFPI